MLAQMSGISGHGRKNSVAITREITQEDINLLLTKTTAARPSQEAVMTSHCSYMNLRLKKDDSRHR